MEDVAYERKAKAYVNIEPRKRLLGLHLQFKPTSNTKLNIFSKLNMPKIMVTMVSRLF